MTFYILSAKLNPFINFYSSSDCFIVLLYCFIFNTSEHIIWLFDGPQVTCFPVLKPCFKMTAAYLRQCRSWPSGNCWLKFTGTKLSIWCRTAFSCYLHLGSKLNIKISQWTSDVNKDFLSLSSCASTGRNSTPVRQKPAGRAPSVRPV